MWTDYYLKFDDEAAFMAVGATCGLVGDEGVIEASMNHALDVVGVLYGLEGTPVAGWHINLRLAEELELDEGLAAYLIEEPEFPKRVFVE